MVNVHKAMRDKSEGNAAENKKACLDAEVRSARFFSRITCQEERTAKHTSRTHCQHTHTRTHAHTHTLTHTHTHTHRYINVVPAGAVCFCQSRVQLKHVNIHMYISIPTLRASARACASKIHKWKRASICERRIFSRSAPTIKQ